MADDCEGDKVCLEMAIKVVRVCGLVKGFGQEKSVTF